MSTIFIEPTIASCSLATLDGLSDSLFGLTCLHSVRPGVSHANKQYKPDDYEQISMFIKCEIDVNEAVWKTHEYLSFMLQRSVDTLPTIDVITNEFVKILKKRYLRLPSFVCQTQLCLQFLKDRHTYIQASSSKSFVS